jgi:hypothetical protein
MAEGASQRSPWARGLAISGALFLVLGAIIVSSQNEALDSVFDPREISIAQIEGENDVRFDVQKDGCYMALVKDGESDMDVTLTPIIGSDTANEALVPESCFSDWFPMASDGVVFEIHEQWIADENGEMFASSSCSEEKCQEQTVWLAHIDQWQELKIFESGGLIFGFGICCLGFLFLPIAGILAYSARSNRIHGAVRIVGPNGELLQSFENQEEMLAAMEGQNSPLHQNASNENLGEDPEHDDGFVDGSKDVTQGTLMTTEQVYAFMRGDAPEAVRQVGDPFADSPAPVKQTVERPVANTEVISDWDTGGGDEIKTASSSPTRRKSIELKEEDSESKNWSVWDDM